MTAVRVEHDDRAPPTRGLSGSETAARLARDGPNLVVPERRGHRLKRLVGPLADPMVALLLLAAPTYLLIGETTDAAADHRWARFSPS
jgi:cation-transporting ATPase F